MNKNKTRKLNNKKNTVLKYALSVFLILILVSTFWFYKNNPETAEATWWNDQWSYRKSLTINSSQVAGDLTYFPVLVSLTDADLSTHAQEDGDDFIFIDDEGKKLSHEIESYASSTGTLVAWVKVPSLSSTQDTDIYMYYGNASASDQSDAGNVWDDNYKMVQHLEEIGTVNRMDSTRNNCDGTATNYSGDEAVTGQIDGADDLYEGDNDYIDVGNPSALDFGDAITISAWVKRESSNEGRIISKHALGSNYGWLLAHNSSSDTFEFALSTDGTSWSSDFTSANSFLVDTMYFVVATFDGSTKRVYVNGSEDTGGDFPASISGSINISTGPTEIGRDNNQGDSYSFDGTIDEVRVSSIARSTNWIQTSYNNQNNPSAFFSEGAEETGPGPVGYWSFDEGYGTTAHDESGQGNSGTINGAKWTEEEYCVSGKCLYFDGTDDDVAVPDDNSLDLTEKWTLNAWVKTVEDPTGFKNIIGKGNGGAYSYYVDIDADLNVNTGFEVSGLEETNKKLELNKWYFISATFNNSTNVVEIYIDGNIEHSGTSGTAPTVNDVSLFIGSFGGSDEFWKGYIDEVKIYSYVRTANQILQDYNAGLAGVKSNSGVSASFGGASDKWLSDGLVGYWKFDEVVGATTVYDSSGVGNTGTANGNASTTEGKFGNGVNFDGSGDYFELGNDIDMIEGSTEITVCAWAYLNTLGTSSAGDGGIFTRGTNGTDGEILFWYNYDIDAGWNRGYTFNVGDSFEPTNRIDSLADTAKVDTWQFVCGVMNGSYRGIYVDGEPSNELFNAERQVIADDWRLAQIGSWEYSSNFNFDGMIDELHIYSRALSKDEVRRLYEWAPGPVAHWKFDELSGTTAYDSVASSSTAGGNDGAISGATWGRGKYGGALDFKDNDEYVFVDTVDFSNRYAGTYEFWLYNRSNEDNDGFITSQSRNPLIWNNVSGGVGYIRAQFENVSTYPVDMQSSAIPLNTWTHVAVVYDSTGGSIYINGIQNASDTSGSNIYDQTGSFYIGNDRNSAGRTIDGVMDDVRIYNYARTQKQILEDMNGGKEARKSPVLHLSFDEGRGATAYDSSVHQNNGSLQPGTGGTNTSSSSMWTKNGRVNGAMEFDGTDDYVDVGDIDIIDNSRELTGCAWVFHDDLDDDDCVFSTTIDSNGNITLIRDLYGSLSGNSNTYKITIRDSENDLARIEGSTNASRAQEWTHVCFSLVTNSATGLRLYVNGIEDENSPVSAADVDDVDSGAGIFRVGVAYDDADEFDGQIDEVKIWNYALSVDEIKTEYNQGKSLVVEEQTSANNNGTTVTGASTEYCVPGDTAQCDAPVLEFRFDEMGGSTAYDTSGQGNDGNIINATWQKGKKGSALEFDGYYDYVQVDNMDLSTTDALTLSFWFNTDIATTANKMLLEYSTQAPTNNAFYINMNENCTGCIRLLDHDDTGGTSDLNYVYTSNSYTDGNWHYFVGTIDRGLGVGQNKIYIDGVLDATAGTYYNDLSGNYGGAYNLYVISRAGGNEFLDGLIDDVKIYDYARTPAQIAHDYNGGKPIAHWRFDECAGGTIHDESENGNHGTLNLGTSGVTATGTCASSSDSFWYNGRNGKNFYSGSFDGTDDYVEVSGLLGEPTNITVSAWVNFSSIDTYGGEVFSLGDYVSLRVDRPSYGIHGFYYDGSDWRITESNIYKSGEGWHHVLYFIDDDNDNQELYIDGELAASTSYSGSITYTGQGTNLNIGRHANGVTSVDYMGLIDDVKIWNYALTVEQIKAEYTGGAVSFGE